MQGSHRQVFPIDLSDLTSFILLTFSLLLVLCSFIRSLRMSIRLTLTTNQYSLIWRRISSGLLGLVGYCYVGMSITNFWKLFCYGIKRYHYEKLFAIREIFERLALDCFNNSFSDDTGTPANNIHFSWLDQWGKYSFYFPCTSFFQLCLSLRKG